MIETLSKIFRRYNFARQIYRIVKGIDLSLSIPQINPIIVKKSRFDLKRINLVIPSINKEHFFGGVSTALNLFEAMTDLNTEKLQSRIILTDAIPAKEDLKKIPNHRVISFEEDSDEDHQIVATVQKNQRNLFVCSGDRFLPTSWWTAYCTIHMVRQQAILYGEQCNRMGYLIQDYEPGFYNWSTHYALAESTYRSDVVTIPIFNSKFLKNYFQNNGYRFYEEFVFEPKLNPTLERFLTSIAKFKRDNKILIYGRPSVARNCFSLIIESLKRWASLQSNLQEWEVISVGEGHKPIPIGNGKVIRSLGKLSLEDYAELLLRSAIGISLMVSPHPSYPPLEMAHFGLLTITNSYANKNLSCCHENIYSIDCLTPDRIADALLSRTWQFSEDPHAGLRGKSLIPSYCNHAEMFPFVEALFKILFSTL